MLGSKRDARPERDDNGDRKHGWQGPTGPENTLAEKAFYRQRESGYRGPLTSDGLRCDDQGNPIGGDV